MVKPFEELKKQALTKISEKEFDRHMKEWQKHLGDAPPNVVAHVVVLKLGIGTPKKREKQEVYDVKSLSEQELECFLNIPVYLLGTRKVKKRSGDGFGQIHRAVDKDYNFVDLPDWEFQIEKVDDTAKRVMLHSVLYSTYQGRPQLKIVKDTKVREIQSGGFELPAPTTKFNGLKENKLYILEGYGVPGSIKIGEKVVKFEMSDRDSNGLLVVLFSEVFDPLERTLEGGLDNLDWCKLRVTGDYTKKEVRGSYDEFDVVHGIGVQVLAYHAPPDEEKEIERQKKEIDELYGGMVEEPAQPKPLEERLAEILKEPVEEVEFLEWLEVGGYNAEVELKRLLEKGVVKEIDGLLHITNVEKVIPNKPEDIPIIGEDISNKQVDITNMGKNDLAITMANVLERLDKELQKKVKDFKGVKTEEWRAETENVLHTQVKDSEFEKIKTAMYVDGAIYEPVEGRWRRV